MIKRALLVHPDVFNIAESMTQWLNEACSSQEVKFRLDLERYRQDAEISLNEERYDLVISHLNIQFNPDTSLDEQQKRKNGLELLKQLRSSGNKVPTLIISPIADRQSYPEVNSLEPAELVADGINLERDFKLACKQLHQPTANVQESEKTVNVDIAILQDPRSSNYHIKGNGFAFEDEGGLVVNSKRLKELGELSDRIAKESQKEGSRWKDDFALLGKELRSLLFDDENNKNFFTSYTNVLGMVNNKVEKFRFRFKVEEDTYRIVFEALSRDNNDFIMVRAPMYRRLMMKSDRYALYHDPDDRQRSLNCLVIHSDVSGEVRGLQIELDKLNNIDDEVELWEKEFSVKHAVGNVKIIKRAKEGLSFYETVIRELESHWDVVHFAGHSAYIRETREDEHKKGFLFFPGAEGKIEEVPLEDFASLLYDANVRLVYLSSCHSSEKGFVFEMVKQNVPAAIGFRWDIDDDMAVKFTKHFYNHLFEDKSLEGAFLKTRKDLFRTNNENPIWAAAMLIVQI